MKSTALGLLKICFIVPAMLFSMGCKKGALYQFPTDRPLSAITTLLEDYDQIVASVRVRGSVEIENSVPLNQLMFYGNSNCSGTLLGQALVRDLPLIGAVLTLPLNQTTSVYVRTDANPTCAAAFEYRPNTSAVPAPIFQTTVPASPSRTNYEPAFFGTASPTSGTVDFYTDSSCTQQIATGTPTDYQTRGIQVTLTPNSSTTIYAQTTDQIGQVSACAMLTTYVHSLVQAQDPVFVSTTPASPTNASSTPLVKGIAHALDDTVVIYSDPSCTTELSRGTGDEFSNTGIGTNVPTDATTTLYAKAIDVDNNPSGCMFMTTYIHDSIAPGPPTFTLADPPSPTRTTLYPKFAGTLPVDALTVRLYNSSNCQTQIGGGRKNVFESTGVVTAVGSNMISSIYATAVDAAGNPSPCTYLANYKHNVIPPDPPVFGGTTPISPTNQTTTPLVFGASSPNTISLDFYNDDICAHSIGNGAALDYDGAGITITGAANTNTTVYVTATDEEGNVSDCAFLANYAHSNLPAPNALFTLSYPVSPTRVSNQPYIVGTAPNTVVLVGLFGDASCTVSLGSGSRLTFATSGIQSTLPMNSTSTIYAQTTDIYGNNSTCQSLTTFIHNTIPPMNPTFTSITPISPTNLSSSPVLRGNSFANPASQLPPSRVSFFDSSSCVSKLGEGTPAAFQSGGITIGVPENTTTMIYARAFDEAANQSQCVHLTTFTHDVLVPGRPLFTASTPATPSYSATTNVTGVFAGSPDFLDKVNVSIYSDSSCSLTLSSGSPTQFQTTGIPVTVPLNATTLLFAASFNEVGTKSLCSQLVNFKHSNAAPTGLSIATTSNGAINFSWLPDIGAQPAPVYIVKRSTRSGGPYTVLNSANTSTSYRDTAVSNNVTYYYRVASKNNTGVSLDSAEISITSNASAPVPANSLSATAAMSEVLLTWSGFPQNMTYKIMRATQSGGPYTVIREDFDSTTFADKPVSNGQPLYYVVHGSNPAGESAQSNEASATPLDIPDVPEGLTIEPFNFIPSCSGPGIVLSWSATSHANSYDVFRRVYTGTTLNANVTSPQRVDCLPDSYVSAVNAYSVQARWGSLGSPVTPEAIFFNTGTAGLFVHPGHNHILLNWAATTATVSTSVYRSTRPQGPYALLAANVSGTTYTDNAVTNGNSYYYWTQGYNGSGILNGFPSTKQGGTPGPNPGPSSNLVLTVDAFGYPVLNWTPSQKYNRFYVYRASDLGGPYTLHSAATSNTFTDNLPNTGMNYYYVTTQWGTHETAPTNIVSFRSANVTDLVATGSASQIDLVWNTTANAQDYRVLRATISGGPYTSIGLPTSESFSDTTALAGQGYYYIVTPRFNDGTQGTSSAAAPAMRTGSSVPSGLTVTEMTASSISLTWVPVPNATGYRVYYGLSSSGPFTSVNEAATSHSFNSLSIQTNYFLKVGAIVGGNEFQSDPINGQTLTAPLPPSADSGNNQLDVAWTPLVGVDSYTLERSTDGVNFSIVGSGIINSNFTDSAVVNGQIYFYRLRAVYSIGVVQSPSSPPFTPGITPAAPSAPLITGNSAGTELTLAWAPVSGATRYGVYVSTISGGYVTPYITTSSNANVLIAGLPTGVPHYFAISAMNGTLESAKSPESSAVPMVTPAAPVAQYASPTTINLTWSAVAGAATYSVDRSVNGETFVQIASGLASASYVDTPPDAQTTYFYVYRPVTAAGATMATSATSAGVQIHVAPHVPSGFTAIVTSTSAVRLNWVQVPGVARYEVFRSTVSGSGYSLIATLLAPTTSTDNTGLTPGMTYYYVVRSVNSSGVASAYSQERSVTLVSAPTGLAVTNNGARLDLSWTSVAMATSYRVLRSTQSGGPYGLVGSPTGTSFQDSNTLPGQIYYYTVSAIFAGGTESMPSNEASATKAGVLSLQTPIEMIDRGLMSLSTESRTFGRSLTSFNTNDYDGSVTYSLEVVAQNYESSPQNVTLVDAANATVATLSVPGSTSEATRMEIPISLGVGPQNLRLRLAQTPSGGTLVLYSARLLVNQVGATRTRLYVPLLTSGDGPTQEDLAGEVGSTSSSNFVVPSGAISYLRKTMALSRIQGYNAWQLDALVASGGTARGSLNLMNMTSGVAVDSTLTEFEGPGLHQSQISIDEGVTGFGSAQENHAYKLQIRCDANCASNMVSVHKAGLWVKLEHLTKAEVLFRNSPANGTVFSDSDFLNSRTKVDLTRFTNPILAFQAEVATSMTSTTDIRLKDASTDDSGGASLTAISSSAIAFSSGEDQAKRSGVFVLAPNHRVVTSIAPLGGSVQLRTSFVVIGVAP